MELFGCNLVLGYSSKSDVFLLFLLRRGRKKLSGLRTFYEKARNSFFFIHFTCRHIKDCPGFLCMYKVFLKILKRSELRWMFYYFVTCWSFVHFDFFGHNYESRSGHTLQVLGHV